MSKKLRQARNNRGSASEANIACNCKLLSYFLWPDGVRCVLSSLPAAKRDNCKYKLRAQWSAAILVVSQCVLVQQRAILLCSFPLSLTKYRHMATFQVATEWQGTQQKISLKSRAKCCNLSVFSYIAYFIFNYTRTYCGMYYVLFFI